MSNTGNNGVKERIGRVFEIPHKIRGVTGHIRNVSACIGKLSGLERDHVIGYDVGILGPVGYVQLDHTVVPRGHAIEMKRKAENRGDGRGYDFIGLTELLALKEAFFADILETTPDGRIVDIRDPEAYRRLKADMGYE